MLKLNNKGFTVVELIMSFLFASILALSLFSVIISYRDKQMDTTIENKILDFKAKLIMDVQKDIQLRGLKEINYCSDGSSGIEARCLILTFNDDTTKRFSLKERTLADVIKDDEGHTLDEFTYRYPYITYGDLVYEIPDATNVYINDDYILQKTSLEDGIESGTVLYKINFNMSHEDLDTDVNISIVANGTKKVEETAGSYRTFNIGDIVFIQLNKDYQKQFRVIQFSNSHKKDLTLLYDDVYDESLLPSLTDYNILENNSSRYQNSKIKSKIDQVHTAWYNASEIRLITTEEVSRIASFCPQYRGIDSLDVSLSGISSSVASWLLNKDYWTMSEKRLSNDDNGKKVWYVNGPGNTLSSDYVNNKHALRPVIVIDKVYVTN